MSLSNMFGTQATEVAGPRVPSVNLMPPEIAEQAKFRRFQLAMGGAVAGAIVVVGALFVHAHGGVSSAQNDYNAATAEQTTLQSKLAGLKSVQDVYTQVAAKQAMLDQALSGEIKWSNYLTDLSLKVPDNVWLTDVNASETLPATGATAPPVSATPSLTDPGIGTITFAGVAFSHDDVATWLDVLAKEPGFANAYFSNSTEGLIGTKPVTNFTSSVTLTAAAQARSDASKAGS